MTTPKFGADTPEVADDVLGEHADKIERARETGAGRLVTWLILGAIYVVAFGFAWLALSAAVYGVYRLIRWTIGWF